MCIVSQTHYGRCKHAFDRVIVHCNKYDGIDVRVRCPNKEYRYKSVKGSFGVGPLCPACETGKRLSGDEWVEF